MRTLYLKLPSALIFLIPLIMFLFLPPTCVFAQDTHTVSGYIKDKSNGEALIGATVAVESMRGKGASTNVYGFFSLTLEAHEYKLRFSYVGYETRIIKINLNQDKQVNIELAPQDMELEEVVVEAKGPEQNVKSLEMSRENLQVEKIKTMPALFGEVDLLRTIQLLPGIQSAGEGTTGLFVRGGASDQNLILLDEATVYNPSHFLGFFSVFNPDAIKNVEVYKGGIPAKFGGRISSIVDIQMNDGNYKKYGIKGGIGLLSSRLTVEGPIKKDSASFIVSGRRTYFDLFRGLATSENAQNSRLYFYDLNAKANYTLNQNNKLFLSGYFGRDVFNFNNNFGLDWGNITSTLRWNHLFNDKLFMNSTFLYSNYDYGFDINTETNPFTWQAKLREYNIKLDFSYFPNPENSIDFGSNTIVHQFEPAEIIPGKGSSFDPFALDDKFAVEQAFYAGNEQQISDKISIRYGLRYSMFGHIGPGRVFQYKNDEPTDETAIIDTVEYDRFENIQFYDGLEPRFSMRYLLGGTSSLKASYNRMQQYLQIASNSTAGLPIDRWIPADKYIKPITGDQVALGYFNNFFDNNLETSVEVYYKWMDNVIDFKTGANTLLTNAIETEVLDGSGKAYGAEFMIRKNTGRTTGWLSYTLSKTRRTVEGINGGEPYPPRYDRTHDVSLVLSHQLAKRWLLSATWVYATGSAVTFPSGRYEVDGKSVAYYDPLRRNANRMPPYHRMDLSATLESKEKEGRKWQSSWNFSIYNVYARKNPFSITFEEVINENPDYEQDEDGPVKTKEPGAVKTYLFSIIPSVTYNFEF